LNQVQKAGAYGNKKIQSKNMRCQMMLRKRKLFVLAVALLSSSILSANEVIMQNTEAEMKQELIRKPVLYRTLFSKKRTIVVTQSIDNIKEEKAIEIDENVDIPRVKTIIEFDYDSSALKHSSHVLLKRVGNVLMSDELKGKNIMINGHTDSDGTKKYNMKLSFDRAESVKAYLVADCNISPDRLQIRGYGELMPLPNTNYNNKQANRRVEFEIDNE
jgi:OmpA-OmpF porin, OOP family